MGVAQRIKDLCKERGISIRKIEADLGFSNGYIGQLRGESMDYSRAASISEYLDVPISSFIPAGTNTDPHPAPGVTEDYVTFDIIGNVAAGYDRVAYEDWENGQISIPVHWLRGRPQEEYFVLRVIGDSMFPKYEDGDVVLVKKQNAVNYSGEIAVVIYGDDNSTLKKVDYVSGRLLKLTPVNPAFPPVTLRDEELEHCRILGVPVLLVRTVTD